jgi:hypothetical protein
MILDLQTDLARAAAKAADEDGISLPDLVRRALVAMLVERGLYSEGGDEGLRPDELTSENDD